ncbi:hypothetical protein BSL78_15597 [Apostichopus japonicus]|uniref:Protein kinase domain-containing protein n=1 Tax=Stichopus japonicus TaxID=307972 RepID=A0A2G8KHV4_STIJA|nr:hypothetical protein BSL78_15597 [Apostichopus japonicus]
MFKLPKLAGYSPRRVVNPVRTYKEIPCFNYNDVTACRLIGAGSFGEVFLGSYKKEEVVLKVLPQIGEKELIKEARFLHFLRHNNLVQFKAMCLAENALMMEYVTFSFSMFGKEKSVSSLDGLLTELNKNNLDGFEHLIPCIAVQVVDGLRYLHGQNVVHRDIKPGNILVSNQHFQNNALNEDDKRKLWTTDPCRIKLTDFGESWGNICQTSNLAKTHTVNIYKGTTAFMAPEIVSSTKRPEELSVEQLKMTDVWSLGMLFFCLLNPDCKVPYLKESSQEDKRKWVEYISEKTANGILPEGSMKYEHIRASTGIHVYNAFLACVKVDPVMRLHVDEVKAVLTQTNMPDTTFPFKVHQGSALIQAQEEHLKSGMFQVPLNDGTNACTFLALKFAELMLTNNQSSWEEMKIMAERVIQEFPEKINQVRDEAVGYEVEEAYFLMLLENLIAEHNLSSCCLGHRVFSKEGRKELADILSRDSGMFIVTVPPITFVLGKANSYWFVVDTHVMRKFLVWEWKWHSKVFHDSDSAKHWIWKRLAHIHIRASMLGVTEISRVNAPQNQPSHTENDLPDVDKTNGRKLNDKSLEKDSVPDQYFTDENSVHCFDDNDANSFPDQSQPFLPLESSEGKNGEKRTIMIKKAVRRS